MKVILQQDVRGQGKKGEMKDASLAEEIFTVLMGEKVEARRDFIEQNARYVVNLDV